MATSLATQNEQEVFEILSKQALRGASLQLYLRSTRLESGRLLKSNVVRFIVYYNAIADGHAYLEGNCLEDGDGLDGFGSRTQIRPSEIMRVDVLCDAVGTVQFLLDKLCTQGRKLEKYKNKLISLRQSLANPMLVIGE